MENVTLAKSLTSKMLNIVGEREHPIRADTKTGVIRKQCKRNGPCMFCTGTCSANQQRLSMWTMGLTFKWKLNKVFICTEMSCTSCYKISRARERRMFLCNRVSSARLRWSATLICCGHVWRSWDDRSLCSCLRSKTLSPASTLPCQSAVPGVDAFWSTTPSIPLPANRQSRASTVSKAGRWLSLSLRTEGSMTVQTFLHFHANVEILRQGASGYLESRKTLRYVSYCRIERQTVPLQRLSWLDPAG